MRFFLSAMALLGFLSSWRFAAWIGAGTGRFVKFLLFLLAWVFSQSFWLSHWLPRVLPSVEIPPQAELICSLSAPWLGLSLCVFLGLDLLRLCGLVFFEASLRRWTGLGACLMVAGLILWGVWTASQPVVGHYALVMPSLQRSLKVLVVSDLHLGNRGMSKEKMARAVELIRQENPHIVFIAGDVVDREVAPLEDPEMLALLAQIRAPLGVFACLGNHDNFMGLQLRISDLLAQAGIRVLYDEALSLPEAGLKIVGRANPSGPQQRPRSPLAALVGRPSPGETLILLDHDPKWFDEAVGFGAHLQISGHTHNGQYFPANLLVKAFYEKPWGLLTKGATALFTTCGLGTWGAPMRLGSVSEIAVLYLLPQAQGPSVSL